MYLVLPVNGNFHFEISCQIGKLLLGAECDTICGHLPDSVDLLHLCRIKMITDSNDPNQEIFAYFRVKIMFRFCSK